MNNEELVKEFSRWVDNGKGDTWYRNTHTMKWYKVDATWAMEGEYVTNDIHAELRRLQIDKPDTVFEFNYMDRGWETVIHPVWDIDREYRVKVEPEYEYQYMYKIPTLRNEFALTAHRENCTTDGYTRVEDTKRERIKNG